MEMNREKAYEVELFKVTRGRQKREIVSESLEALAARAKAADGRAVQFRCRTMEDAVALEEELRGVVCSCRDGRLVTAWDTHSRTAPALLEDDPWATDIRKWVEEEPGLRAHRDLTALEVGKRALMLDNPSRSELTRVAKCLRALGYQHVVVGQKRLNAWRPPMGGGGAQ